MAIAFVVQLTSGNSGTSSTTLVLTTVSPLAIGDLAVIGIAADNIGSGSNGDFNDVSSVTDSGGNTWTKAGEATLGSTAAGAGVTASIWYTRATAAVANGGTITVTWPSAIVAKAARCQKYTCDEKIIVSGTPQKNYQTANDFGSAVISGLPSKERLYFRAMVKETNSATVLTPTTSYTNMGVSTGNGGTIGTSATFRGEFRILTGTGDTSNPSMAVSVDTASVFVALEESVPVTGTLAATDAVDTASFDGDVVVTGTLAATDAIDTASISGITDVTFVSEGIFTLSGAAGTKTVNFSGATRLENDIVVVAAATDGTGNMGNPLMVTSGYNYLIDNEATGFPDSAALWKRLGSTPDSDMQLTHSGTGIVAGLWQIFRLAHPVTAIDNGVNTQTGISPNMPNPPDHTTVTSRAMRVLIGFLDDDDSAASVVAPAGYTHLLAADTGQASTTIGSTVMIASKLATTAGAENPAPFTSATGDDNVAIHFAFRPTSGATTTTGILAATDPVDTAAFTGTVSTSGVTGDLAATDPIDTAAFTGTVSWATITGTLAATDPIDTAAFTGDVIVTGNLAATDPIDTAAFTGDVIVTGNLAATDPIDTAAFTGDVIVTGNLAATDPIDTAAFTGIVSWGVTTGNLAATDPIDTAAFTGTVSWGVITGTLAATDPVDTASFLGDVLVKGALAATDPVDTAAFLGDVLVKGALAATDPIDTAAIFGTTTAVTTGILAATDPIDTALFTGQIFALGTWFPISDTDTEIWTPVSDLASETWVPVPTSGDIWVVKESI